MAEGDIAKQVDTIIDIAETAMGKAGGCLEDVVRSRIYVTDIELADAAAPRHGLSLPRQPAGYHPGGG